MSYLEPILGHPVRRQIFGDTSGQTFYMTRDPVLPPRKEKFVREKLISLPLISVN